MANVLAGKTPVQGAFCRKHIVYRLNTSIIQLTAYLPLYFGNAKLGGSFGDADFAYSIGGVVHDIQTASIRRGSKSCDNFSRDIVDCIDYWFSGPLDNVYHWPGDIIYNACHRSQHYGHDWRRHNANGTEGSTNQRTLCRAFRRRLKGNASDFTIECSVFLDSRDSSANSGNSSANKRA